ncbi:MAG: hypothetical protein LBM07_07415 [Culturomica sp.]|jgi:hypothetical protein|nr:hypothetical protein [Culturomica sp.]
MEWQNIFPETNTENIFKSYVIPFSVATTILTFPINLISHTLLYTLLNSLCELTASIGGTYIAFICVKEYLSGNIKHSQDTERKLIYYSSLIFVVFNILGSATELYFLSQVLTLISIASLRTLYFGIKAIKTSVNKTNLFIISALTIICLPLIIKRLLMIVLHLPAINL